MQAYMKNSANAIPFVEYDQTVENFASLQGDDDKIKRKLNLDILYDRYFELEDQDKGIINIISIGDTKGAKSLHLNKIFGLNFDVD